MKLFCDGGKGAGACKTNVLQVAFGIVVISIFVDTTHQGVIFPGGVGGVPPRNCLNLTGNIDQNLDK